MFSKLTLVIPALFLFLLSSCALFEPSPLPIVFPTPPSGPISWRHFGTGNDPIHTIALEGEELWLGTSKGIITFNTFNGLYSIYTPANTEGGFVSRGVYIIALDPDGSKWVGTYGGGLSRFDGTNWKHFSSADGLGDNWIYDVVFDASDQMWVATWSGVSVFDGEGRFTTYTEEDGLADKWVYAIALDEEGVFWFGTEAGVSRFDGQHWTTFTHEDGIGADIENPSDEPVISPLPSTAGMGDDGEGAYGSSSSAQHHMVEGRHIIGANPNFIISAVVDRHDDKWFGTWGAGLTRFDGETWTMFTTDEGLGGNYIFSLAVDESGRVWAGTNGGVSWYDGEKWQTITVDDGLLDNNVFAILFDQHGHRWFGTLKGLSVFRGGLPS